MSSVDDKAFATNCANIKGLSEIVEFISSSNTQLFILWLESLDKAFIEEAESPELLTKNNESKGYANEWTQRKNYKKSF